jgi:hypothetical protein
MKITFIESPKSQAIPPRLSYSDMIRITGIKSDFYRPDENQYFIIAQVGYSMLTLFDVNPNHYPSDTFNRAFDPVTVNWGILNTENLKEILPWKCAEVEKLDVEMTITIKE